MLSENHSADTRAAIPPECALPRWKSDLSIRRNTLVNLAGQVAPMAVTLLTVPQYLGLIGEARYGVLAICWTLLGYFGMFDLGLGQATAQRMATLRDASAETRGSLLQTALLLSGGLGLLAGVLFWLVGQMLLTRFIYSGGALHAEALVALPWLAAILPITIFSSALSGALTGRERFVALNQTQVLGIVFGQILPLAVAWSGGTELARLIPAALLARLVTTLLLLRQCRRHVPLVPGLGFKSEWIRQLFSYGGWISLNSAVAGLLSGIEPMLIATIAGAKAVTLFSIPFSLTTKISILPMSLSAAIFPRFAAESNDQQIKLKQQAIRALVAIMTFAVASALFGLEPFLAVWINSDFAARATHAGELLLLGIWINSFAFVPLRLLLAQGRPDVVTKLYLLQIIPYLGLLYECLTLLAAAGAALAWSVRVAVDTVMLFIVTQSTWNEFRLILKSGIWISMAASTVFFLQPEEEFRWVIAAILLPLIALWSWRMAPNSMKYLIPIHYFRYSKARI